MQEEEVPVWWWPVTALAGSAGLIAVGTVIAWQELNAAPQWGEWDILYSIDGSPRRTIMWGDINDLIFRLKDTATAVGKTCTIDDYRLLRTHPEKPRRYSASSLSTRTPEWGEWEINYKINQTPRKTVMWGDLSDVILRFARLSDAAMRAGRSVKVLGYKLLRERPEEPIRLEETHSRMSTAHRAPEVASRSPQFEGSSKNQDLKKGVSLKWVRDSADIYWTSTKEFIHSLYYDEEDKVYVWYVHKLKDFEELKREIFFPPIYRDYVFEAENMEAAKKHVEESLFKEELERQHPELVDEIVKAREKAYRMLKKLSK